MVSAKIISQLAKKGQRVASLRKRLTIRVTKEAEGWQWQARVIMSCTQLMGLVLRCHCHTLA
jgi:hypothetical protein